MKDHRSISSFQNATNIKSYLFRTVTNTWIDHCRKIKIKVELYENDFQNSVVVSQDNLEIEEALEYLICGLPPLQCVVFLLIEVFAFSCLETAQMINSNENSVKSALFRARKKIQSLSLKNLNNDKASNNSLLEAFMNAFNKNDPLLISRAYQNLKTKGYEVQRTSILGKLCFTISDPDGNKLLIS
jgi:RNA polymerase sigma factor (sigma-70 family)